MAEFNYGDRVKIAGVHGIGFVEGLSLGQYTVRFSEGFFTRRDRFAPERLAKCERVPAPYANSAEDGVSLAYAECCRKPGETAEQAKARIDAGVGKLASGVICMSPGSSSMSIAADTRDAEIAGLRAEVARLQADNDSLRKRTLFDFVADSFALPAHLAGADRPLLSAIQNGAKVDAARVAAFQAGAMPEAAFGNPLTATAPDTNIVVFDSPCPVCGEAIAPRTAAYVCPNGEARHVGCAVLLAHVDERTKGEMKYAISRYGAGKPCGLRHEPIGTCCRGDDIVYTYFTDDGLRCAACIRKMIRHVAEPFVIPGPVTVNAGTKDEYVAQNVSVTKESDKSRFFNVPPPTPMKMRLKLEPVGKEWDGEFKPIKELSYAPPLCPTCKTHGRVGICAACNVLRLDIRLATEVQALRDGTLTVNEVRERHGKGPMEEESRPHIKIFPHSVIFCGSKGGPTKIGAPELAAATITWIGRGRGGDWSDPANWDAGRVPGITDHAIISSGATISTGVPKSGAAVVAFTVHTGAKIGARSEVFYDGHTRECVTCKEQHAPTDFEPGRDGVCNNCFARTATEHSERTEGDDLMDFFKGK